MLPISMDPVKNDRKHNDLDVGGHGFKTSWRTKGLGYVWVYSWNDSAAPKVERRTRTISLQSQPFYCLVYHQQVQSWSTPR